MLNFLTYKLELIVVEPIKLVVPEISKLLLMSWTVI